MAPSSKIAIISFGTLGDVKPQCLLAQALTDRGHDVTLVINAEYEKFCQSYAIKVVPLKSPLDEPTDAGIFAALSSVAQTLRWATLRDIRRRIREVGAEIGNMLEACWNVCASADLVIHNSVAFFCGEFARQNRIPSIHVMMQPLLPSAQYSLCLFGGRQGSHLFNRLSYEIPRLFPFLIRGGFRDFHRKVPQAGRIPFLSNPLTLGLPYSRQIAAFSPLVSPVPPDWPNAPAVTGFWFSEPSTDMLPEAVSGFLQEGEPPVYIGFGSMFWNSGHNTRVILEGLKLWGGRAIISNGGGALRLPEELPGNLLKVGFIDHASLFPHVAAAVHHGGAGTTAQALCSGIPSIIYPMFGDQRYWGARVAALGAGLEPMPLKSASPEAFARRLEAVYANPSMMEAARAAGEHLRRESGVRGAVELADRVLQEAHSESPAQDDFIAWAAAV